jgi:hypothetical protein
MRDAFAARLIKGTISLKQALFDERVPQKAKHLLAHDCARRAILCERGLHRRDVIPAWLLEALDAKMLWIQGMLDDKSMKEIRTQAETTYRENQITTYSYYQKPIFSHSWKHMLQAGLWALSADGVDAAENAARISAEAVVFAKGVTRKHEDDWQRRRLACIQMISEVTERIWLIDEPEWLLPFEQPGNIALDAFESWY